MAESLHCANSGSYSFVRCREVEARPDRVALLHFLRYRDAEGFSRSATRRVVFCSPDYLHLMFSIRRCRFPEWSDGSHHCFFIRTCSW
ncbi:UNVERIFIED_CONTAM: hypothetical protein Slati_3901000 [Sesamum latifolium]|uniref:Uncharacterized protein n=1 Tax=Sesamum latifolium TaxID=2727402 RepID=A0AAW2TQN4_9LAMI